MSIERITNSTVQPQVPVAAPQKNQHGEGADRRQTLLLPADAINISNNAQALSVNKQDEITGSSERVGGNNRAGGLQECESCKNRKYVDRSDDATVSFQSPTKVSPNAAEGAVRAHEQEHVSSEQSKAVEQGRKVVSQSVSIHYGICPECGSSYVSGGTTTTVTKEDSKPETVSVRTPPASSAGRTVDVRV